MKTDDITTVLVKFARLYHVIHIFDVMDYLHNGFSTNLNASLYHNI